MQCFDTFRGFLHELYTATMDGKGRGAHIIFSHDDWGAAEGAGHRAQGAAAPPCHPAGAAHGSYRAIATGPAGPAAAGPMFGRVH